MKRLFLALAGVALAGCAADPNLIAPAYVSTVPYESWTCQQLADEQPKVDLALAQTSLKQKSAQTGDAVGVLLIGLPVSSMGGKNIAPQVANLKGQRDAIADTMIKKRCPQSPAVSGVAKPIPAPKS